ncbi:hypothetical protein PsYK624_088450 [Phanerochaete sordida]|uniref:DUF6533 domain-containing protein n=1 Tax=Phanerochaete sordida TaxID=48140 RepID=A0A9P3GDE2_9APHY|nr:hypothetical protein PsYK624_088450 [Phanerochaete sordida]
MASTQAELAELEALFTTLHLTRIGTYVNVAALCTASYDLLLNLHNEIEQIWLAPWSLPKVLYLLARYYSVIHLCIVNGLSISTGMSDAKCVFFTARISGGPVVFTSLVNVILLLRIRAIFDMNMKVVYPVAFLMICQFGVELSTTVWNAMIVRRIPTPPFIPWPGCLAEGLMRQTLLAWIPCIVVASICASLTVYRFFAVAGITWRTKASSIDVSPLFRQFVWDGTLGFILIFAVNVTCAITTLTVNNALADLPSNWLIVIYALVGAKMILNLRVTAKTTTSMGTQETTLYSDASFAPNPRARYETLELVPLPRRRSSSSEA